MNRNSRSFKMLLALNTKQHEKIKDHKRVVLRNRLNRSISDHRSDNDSDYAPSDADSEENYEIEDESNSPGSEPSTSCFRTQSPNNFQGYTEEQELGAKPKINILSDITLRNLNDNGEPSQTGVSNIILPQKNTIGFPEVDKENNDNDIITEILETVINNVMDKSEAKNFTKKGELRKRKKYDLSQTERKRIKLATTTSKHNVKSSCDKENCKRKCFQKIGEVRQAEINKEFWKLNNNEQKNFILNCASQENTKRKTTDHPTSRRSKTFFYTLKDTGGCKQIVCKVFFLGTLGYERKNDRVVRDALNKTNLIVTAKSNKQGKKGHMKIDRDVIIKHIESFRPTIAHYRREHAPERRYLPSDITITMMYNDFKLKHPNIQFSYYLYREVVSKMKISFVKLGHEECWVCESFDLHSKISSHQKEDLDGQCDECNKFAAHRIKYTSARKQYQTDISIINTTTTADDPVVASADLQKVIMLPRMEMFKEVIFTPRIIAFNESFVITGKKKAFPHAVIWHEAISGRSTQDITSTFYAFLLSISDKKHVILWLDNCSAQNKNWTLFTFFVHIVNSDEVALESLTVKYFEPGHTFMGADSFHHQVERSLKQKGKVYDFEDFADAVRNASNNVRIVNMEIGDFYNWQNGTSQYKLNKISPRPYLNEMVQVNFTRGKKTFMYRTGFEAAEREINFLNGQMAKQGVLKPPPKCAPRGITAERRDLILSKLCGTMPPSRKKFWQDLPISTGDPGLDD